MQNLLLGLASKKVKDIKILIKNFDKQKKSTVFMMQQLSGTVKVLLLRE
jgi:hypothetical protein